MNSLDCIKGDHGTCTGRAAFDRICFCSCHPKIRCKCGAGFDSRKSLKAHLAEKHAY